MTELTLTIDEESPDDRVMVSARGDLDLHTATGLYTKVGELLTRHTFVFMDLSRVAFCDSSGYNALLRLHRRAHEAGSRFILVSPHPTVSRLLALTASDGVFDVYGSRAEAFAAHPVAHDS
ncbi:STAS domain-containing protein [Streptomyces sp. NPDC102467]|uniref:STAS domain-containing protein n=1 Tax=Streptomyces sp. NPDC102467 TaxID=3366179 RepID=UPI0037FB4F44